MLSSSDLVGTSASPSSNWTNLRRQPSSSRTRLQFHWIEALHEGVVRWLGIAEAREALDQQCTDVQALLAVPVGMLDLRVNSDGAAGGPIQSLDEADLLLQRRD